MLAMASQLLDAVYRVPDKGDHLTSDLNGQASTTGCVAAIKIRPGIDRHST